MSAPDALRPEQLYRPTNPLWVHFENTDLAERLTDSFGQQRAFEAMRLSFEIPRPGFNLYVLGDAGSGRHTAVRMLLESRAASGPPPADWCYVHNFTDANRPRAMSLPAGRGAQLRADMRQFVHELGASINAAFESERYRARLEAIQQEYKDKEEQALRDLGQQSSDQGIALLRTPQGFVFAPMKGEEAMDPEVFAKLPEEERNRIGQLLEEYRNRLQALMRQFPRWQSEMQQKARELSRETLGLAVGHLIDELKEKYADLPAVVSYLNEVMQDVVETGEELRGREGPRSEAELANLILSGRVSMDRYQINLIVDRDDNRSAPIVFEDNPNYQNLIGRLDHVVQFGAAVTGYAFIRAGALHRANGGFLMVDVARALSQPFAWDGLKRALKAQQIQIESATQFFGMGGSLPVEPEPIPLDVKVVLIGSRLLYYLLRELDPEFEELFKVAADFDADVVRDQEHTLLFARMVATLAAAHELKPFHRDAVLRIIDHAARKAGDSEKLSVRTRWISDLMAEADFVASRAGADQVQRAHVEEALSAQRRRSGRLEQQYNDLILRGVIRIETEGVRVGQINGLAVSAIGDSVFGHPVRLTATARVGEAGVVDIERETELGGAIHSKGVLILSAYLGARYSPSRPLALSASLVFEQSYGPVEGDSASLAELCALLSALAGVPIRQNLAMTGSVDQHGQVQAIGGVNEKIEGFYRVCVARGLRGDEGVLIPQSNVKDLMLDDELRAVAAEGRFRVFAVSHVDQAIALLTGHVAGEADAAGNFPADTFNARVAARLAEMLELRRQFGAAGKKKDGEG